MSMSHNISKGMRLIQRNADTIPFEVVNLCSGLVVLEQVKGGFFWSGALAQGFVVKRLGPSKWSPPSAIFLASVGFGFQFGFEKVDIVLVLNDKHSVNVFERSGHIKIGADYSVSVGPVGGDVQADLRAGTGGFTGSFSYCTSKGLFAGISLDGGVLITNPAVNKAFYGKGYNVKKILNNEIELHGKAKEKVEHLQSFLVRVSQGKDSGSAKIIPVIDPLEAERTRKETKEKLQDLYTKYNPDKIKDIDTLLDIYQGREEALIDAIVEKYDPDNLKHEKTKQPENARATENSHEDYLQLEGEELKTLETAFGNIDIQTETLKKAKATNDVLQPVKIETQVAGGGDINIKEDTDTLRRELDRAYAESLDKQRNVSANDPSSHVISVIVPQGVNSGDHFSIKAENGQFYTVQCPAGAKSGDWIDVALPFASSQNIALNRGTLQRNNSDLIDFH